MFEEFLWKKLRDTEGTPRQEEAIIFNYMSKKALTYLA
jgi:hypothetical protein